MAMDLMTRTKETVYHRNHAWAITRSKMSIFSSYWSCMVVALALVLSASVLQPAQAEEAPPVYLRDRGPGIPTSLFGSYIQKGEFLFYPFYEYFTYQHYAYKPSDLGYTGEQDYHGILREQQALLYFSYGVSDSMSVELEAGGMNEARFQKDPNDTSAVPSHIRESGLADIEAQVRWRWNKETAQRPEFFSFFEVAYPVSKNKHLIGTQDWKFALGLGVIKGYSWGTMSGRAAFAYDKGNGDTTLDEWAIEYLKRLSPTWRILLAVEGEESERQAIVEAQWQFSKNAYLKVNSGFGLTQESPAWAPEIGIMFSF
jgi:hypothetical protein